MSCFYLLIWALASLGKGFWACKVNRVLLLTVLGVFGAVHFYTQWFVILGAKPFSLFLGGIIAVGIALLFKKLNTGYELKK